MIQKKTVEGDLLYHAIHGLCRVDKIIKQKQSGQEVLSYSLVPKMANVMKVRFIITVAGLQASGFHVLVSLKEANKILDYLKTGKAAVIPAAVDPKTASYSFSEQSQAWDLAQAILSFSHDKFEAKDQRKRQRLELSAKGLVGELALVFRTTLKEAADIIQKNLGNPSKINPLVLTALAHTSEDY